MGLRTWTTAFFFLIVVVVMFPTLLHAQQLGCGGISPRVVLYQQSQPITTSFTVTGANCFRTPAVQTSEPSIRPTTATGTGVSP
jgi:hypothetical protein